MRQVGFGDTQDHHLILLSLRQERIGRPHCDGVHGRILTEGVVGGMDQVPYGYRATDSTSPSDLDDLLESSLGGEIDMEKVQTRPVATETPLDPSGSGFGCTIIGRRPFCCAQLAPSMCSSTHDHASQIQRRRHRG